MTSSYSVSNLPALTDIVNYLNCQELHTVFKQVT